MRKYFTALLVILLWFASVVLVRKHVCLGWLVPLRVASDSMAPALLGPHRLLQCESCGIGIEISAATATDKINCLNCGVSESSEKTLDHIVPGTRVVVDRRLARKQGVKRFDIIAFQKDQSTVDESTEPLRVKRVVGLPGERISVRHGDVVVNDAVVQKTPAQFLAGAILVHDDRFRSDASTSWRATGGWQATEDGYRFDENAHASGGTLRYEHQPNSTLVGSLAQQGTILDEYQYNPDVSRELNAVSDVAVICKLAWSGSGTLALRLPTPAPYRMELELDTAEQPIIQALSFHQADQRLERRTFSRTVGGELELLAGFWDRQLVVQVGDALLTANVEETPDTTTPQPVPDGNCAIEITAMGIEQMNVRVLRVVRDVHYYWSARGLGTATQDTAARTISAGNRFVVFGDNVPRSADALKDSPLGFVHPTNVIGIVVPVQD